VARILCRRRTAPERQVAVQRKRIRGFSPGTLLLALLLALPPAVAAQTGTVTGRVSDSQRLQPLASAQVTVADLGIGALTQQNGRFILLNVPAGTHTVNVQRIGYRPSSRAVTVVAGETVNLDFEIAEQALALDEIVVTGTPGGTQRRAIGNVVSRVRAEEVTERAAISNMQELLTGRAPGLHFQRTTGNIGTGSQIRIRGVSSLTLGQQPLIFVDGVRVDNRTNAGPNIRGGSQSSALDDFNPEDIESVEIIKGPAAATLYGTEASAGVIQIITKKGVQGSPQFDVTMHQGTNFMIDPAGRLGTQWACRVSTRPCPRDQLYTFNVYEHERDVHGNHVFQYGHSQGYNLGVRGGTDAIRYFLSGDFDDQEGIVSYNNLQRMSLRGNVGVLLNEALRLDVSSGFVRSHTSYLQQINEGGIWEMMQWGQGNLLEGPTRGFLRYTPEALETIDATRDNNRFTGSATLTHEFREFLTQRLVMGLDYSSEENQVLVPRHPDGRAGPFGALSEGRVNITRPLITTATVDYGVSARWAAARNVGMTTSFGAQYYSNEQNQITGTGTVFASPAIRSIDGAASKIIGQSFEQNKSFGVFVQQEAAINDRIYLTAAVRGDDNSAFGADFDAAIYPKVSATWVVSEETFWQVAPVSSLRLRGAWGRAGRQPSTFAAVTIYNPIVARGGQPSVRPGTYGNPNVGPEVSEEIELGFDAAFFNDRISTEATYFSQKTTNALLNVALPPSFSFSGNQAANLGRLDNWGWEVRVDARAVQERRVALDLGFTGSHTMNEIKDLGGVPETNNRRVGLPFPIYTSDVLVSAEFDEFRRPVNLMCDAGTGRQFEISPGRTVGLYPGGELVPCAQTDGYQLVMGTLFPQYVWGMDATLTLLNNLQIFGLAEGEFGRWNSDTNAYGQHPLAYSNVEMALAQDDPVYVEGVVFFQRRPTNTFMYQIYDAAFWKLREVGLRYQLPQTMLRRTGVDRAALSVSGRNLWTIWQRTKDLTGAPITDPELTSPTGGSALGQMPGISSITASLRVSF
jgi:TonB-dependent starch-binding outer membrane protein SusC